MKKYYNLYSPRQCTCRLLTITAALLLSSFSTVSLTRKTSPVKGFFAKIVLTIGNVSSKSKLELIGNILTQLSVINRAGFVNSVSCKITF